MCLNETNIRNITGRPSRRYLQPNLVNDEMIIPQNLNSKRENSLSFIYSIYNHLYKDAHAYTHIHLGTHTLTHIYTYVQAHTQTHKMSNIRDTDVNPL